MPKTKHTAPRQSREKGQRSLDLPQFFIRNVPPWTTPRHMVDGETWRSVVSKQPIAGLCRETLISNFIALDWKIEPKDSDQRDELKSEIDYYTDFFTNTGDYAYDTIIEWVGKDLLDIPFGSGAEIGREGDRPDGKVLWLELLDGATLFPYPNRDWPIYQRLKEVPMQPVFFPRHAINRVYYSPHTKIHLEGWGIPPPEKVYLALELLNRGDVYYANLLLDTPEAGILDLGDMSKESAEEWLKSFRAMLSGIDPLKVPVLYEHNNDVKFLPFGKPPTDLMFDRVTAKYASMIAAGYGLALSDIGIQTTTSGGDTLAGSIRDERKTRRTGFARFKKKMIAFFNFMLPDDLEYKIIDMDDELSVALGRARLANATAAAQYIDRGIFTPQEMRLQAIADGLISVSVPEEIPEDEMPEPMIGGNGSSERPNMIGRPVSPSQGGHGEVLPRGDVFSEEIHRVINVSDAALKQLVRAAIDPVKIEARSVLDELSEAELMAWNDWHDDVLWGRNGDDIPELTAITLSESTKRIQHVMDDIFPWWEINVDVDDVYKEFSESLQILLEKRSEEVGEEETEIYVDKFKEKVGNLIEYSNQFIAESLPNCIIAATKKVLLDRGLIAKSLDEERILHDNKTVMYVRQEIFSLATITIEKFASGLAESINDILEEI